MTERVYPDKLEVKPLDRPPVATISLPGSKSITNRALLLGALSDDVKGCHLDGVLQCEDTEVMVSCLRILGFEIDTNWQRETVDVRPRVDGPAGLDYPFPVESADLFVANSGTSMRFLTALVSLGRGRFKLDGTERMRERPIEPLLAGLRQLGVNAISEFGNGCPPVVIETTGWNGGVVSVRGDVSSQFLSAMLMAAPRSLYDTTIVVEGPLVSEPYVAMTIRMMQDFGFRVQESRPGEYWIQGRQHSSNEPIEYRVEADASAASYFFAAAAIMRGHVTVNGYIPAHISLQGDIEFLAVLEQMGCTVERDLLWNVVARPSLLHSIDVDMNAISDTVMTLAAVACFAEGPTTIRNVAHIRHKETDRLAALATELRRLGAEVDEFADGLTITPRPLHGAEVETYNDHRMAMSLALIGLKVPGVVIKNPGCVAKTYPGFWEDLEKLRA